MTRRRAQAFVLVASLLGAAFLAGCAGDKPDARPGAVVVAACAPDARPSGNAPPIAFLRGTDAQVVARTAAAFGDPVNGNAKGHANLYTSEHGVWRIVASGAIEFYGTGAMWLTNASIHAAIEAFDVPGAPMKELGSGPRALAFHQFVNGSSIAHVVVSVAAGPDGRNATEIRVDRLRDLRDARASLSTAAAEAIVLDYLDCDPAWPRTPARFARTSMAVAQDSLAYATLVAWDTPGLPCAVQTVLFHVDATTGAILQMQPSRC